MSDEHQAPAMTDAMAAITDLLAIMARLRDPNHGCAWDLAQDFASIAPCTIEEAYEVSDAIAADDMAALKGELGDLLLQVVFHSQIAADRGLFGFADVANDIAAKMTRRHPHIFGPATASHQDWESIKAEERLAKRAVQAGKTGPASALDDVARALPALLRAQKLQKRAARVGFDWPDISGPRAKVAEELAELDAADTAETRAEELGDLLFSVVNLARHMGIDAETALDAANRKFERRFRQVEALAAAPLGALDIKQLDALWDQAKAAEI